MIVRAIDVNGDWTFGKGRNNYLSGRTAIGQNIATRLRSFLGDCFFATGDGIDWFNRLGAKNQILLNLDVSSVITNTVGVTSILELSIDLNENRLLTIVYSVMTVSGEVTGAIAEVAGLSELLTQDGDVITTESGEPIGV